MYFHITQMRRLGVALPLDEIRSTKPLEGDVYVQTEQSKPLNRQAEVATVRKKNSAGPEPLNPLLDARLSGMATGAFVLSGVEEIDGCLYAQAWYCKPIDR
jgi:hypothetical protein